MKFKKQKIKSNNKIESLIKSKKWNNKNILNIIWVVSIWLIFILALFVIKNNEIIKLKIEDEWLLSSSTWTITNTWEVQNKEKSNKEEESKWIISSIFWKEKKEDNITNILLTWMWWMNHDWWNLTDSILLAKINTDKKEISLLSIPRDLYVSYPSKYLQEWRINWLYSYFSNKWDNVWEGMNVLKNKIKQITWEHVDYYINIDFNWFIELIDTIWGITLEIPENFVDYEYPDGNWWYRTLVFRKWTWLFSWENTLKYVRSRHSTSDFDRSLRQQKVIMAIKNKLSWSYFLNSPWKIKELYEVFTKNVKTDISLTKVISLAYLLNSKDELKIYSSNMNDSCFYDSVECSKWGILYTPLRDLFDWQSVLLVNWSQKWNISNYMLSKKYSEIVFWYPKMQEENYTVNVFNSTKETWLALDLSYNIKRFGFKMPESNFIWNTDSVYDNSVIYYNNIDKDSDTFKAIKEFYKWKMIKTDFPKYSNNDANLEIVIWNDYLKNKIIYNF